MYHGENRIVPGARGCGGAVELKVAGGVVRADMEDAMLMPCELGRDARCLIIARRIRHDDHVVASQTGRDGSRQRPL